MVLVVPALPAGAQDFHTKMMQCTFAIYGPKGDSLVEGTTFLLGRPSSQDRSEVFMILITAAHILRAIEGDTAILIGRVRDADGDFHKRPIQIPIREGNTPLWVEHPDTTVDAAAFYLPNPDSVWSPVLSIDHLADEKTLGNIELHPGDPLFTLGYPFGIESTPEGFPVLRSAFIASYPLFPIRPDRAILIDMPVYEGNSGGPAYLYEYSRYYRRTIHAFARTSLICGLVSKRKIVRQTGESVQLAVVVPSPLIREVLQLLPEPSPRR